MPLKPGHSPEIVSHNIKEMMKAGRPRKQAIAASLANAKKYKKMAEGGLVEEDMHEGLSMEPDPDRQMQSKGPEGSDARDQADMGPSEPMFPSNVDKGSPKMHEGGASPEDGQFMSDELREMIKKRKLRYSR